MTTATSTTLKTAGVNILALLASYLLQKVADKNTGFVDTRTAITTVGLQALADISTAKLTAMAASTPAATTEAPVTVTQ